MNYTKYEMDNYNLYFIKTKKFKEINLQLCFRHDDNREDQVYRNLLIRVLASSTKKYPNLKDYNKALLSLYSPKINYETAVLGKERSINLIASYALEEYTEIGMNQKTLEFIFDNLLNPNAENSKFDEETFEVCKSKYIEILRSIKNDPREYTSHRIFDESDIYSFEKCDINDNINIAQKITNEELFKYYETIFTNNSLDVFVSGNFDEQKMKEILSNLIKGDFKKSEPNHPITFNEFKKEPNVIIEKSKTEQSQLAVCYKYDNLTDFESKYVSLMFNSILGATWSSKLMTVIREEKSLCYFVYTARRLPLNVFFIFAGIDANKYDEVITSIKEIISNMKKGDFTEAEIEQNKQLYKNALLENEDDNQATLENVIMQVLNNQDNNEERIRNIDKVNKTDVINFINKINLDTIFFLKGDGHNA